MGKHLKILGLSLLALVGVMAVSASAAQAEWLLLLNKVSVLKQTFNITVNEGELLSEKNGVAIHCAGGTGTATIESDTPSMTVLSGEASGKFTGCFDLKFSETCTVHGKGDAAKVISAKGKGTGSMEGTKVLIGAESPEFAKVEYEGEECPLVGIDGTISGGVTLEVLEPLKDAATHTIGLIKQSLKFGQNPAELHNGVVKGGLLSGTASTTTGETSATHLKNLPGCTPGPC